MKQYPIKSKDHSETVLRDKTDTIAVLAADLHFSLKPPIARSCHEDWLEVQRGYARQLRLLSLQAPVIVAGDIFDKWNVPAELVNMLLKELPQIYAVVGNHDLPNHDYEQRKRSAYWTLVEAGKIINVHPNKPVDIQGWHPLRLHGFPCGFDIHPLDKPNDLVCEIAIVHCYMWTSRTGGYVGANQNQKLSNMWPRMNGYDLVVVGDNHSGFVCHPKEMSCEESPKIVQ